MPIPSLETFLLPILKITADGVEHSLSDVCSVLASEFSITEQERNELIPSGRARRFYNRVAWAKEYLKQAGLLMVPRRGFFVITDRGRQLLKEKPERITISILERYDEFRAFATGKRDNSRTSTSEITGPTPEVNPEETLEQAYQLMRMEVISDILNRVKESPPAFFENLVVELLLAMGYGRNRKEAGRAIGGSGDAGIDGIISEDKLGLDVIYIQAKRWEATVGRPDIQRFVGALEGKRAKKGVFITTGSFSDEAKQYVSTINTRVVLIDGQQLAEYMYDLNLGVSIKAIYELKRMDSDYFLDE